MQDTTNMPAETDTAAPSTTRNMKEGRLYPKEIFWRDHYNWLKERGYILRPRYQPDWVASWLNPPRWWDGKEDAVIGIWGHILDATRRSDGAQVILKRIRQSRQPNEVKIAQLFSSAPLASDPRNHCASLYEVLQVPDDDDTVILVMPFLLEIEHIPFDTIGEAVDLFRQIFEGLQFIHQHHFTHGDAKYNNILMDALGLYAEPPHPLRLNKKRNMKGDSKIRWTRTTKPIKYYFIDFGLSKEYSADGDVQLELPGWGGTRSVPEFLRAPDTLCDPFPVDVYCLGNVIREHFLEGFEDHPPKKGFEFMTELVADMVKDDPLERPKMDEVVERYATLMSGLSDEKLRSRIIIDEEKPLERKLNSFRHWCRQTVLRWRGVPAIPTP